MLASMVIRASSVAGEEGNAGSATGAVKGTVTAAPSPFFSKRLSGSWSPPPVARPVRTVQRRKRWRMRPSQMQRKRMHWQQRRPGCLRHWFGTSQQQTHWKRQRTYWRPHSSGCGRSGGAVCRCGLTGIRSRSTGRSRGFALSCSGLGCCGLRCLRSCFFGRSVRSNGSRQRGGYIRGQHIVVVRGNDLRVRKDGRLNLQREAEGGYLSPVRCVQIYFGFLHPGGSERLFHEFDGDVAAVDYDSGSPKSLTS